MVGLLKNQAEEPALAIGIQERNRRMFALVEELVLIGVPVTGACRRIGLDRTTYYRIKKNAPVSDNDGGSTVPEGEPQSQTRSKSTLPDAGGNGA